MSMLTPSSSAVLPFPGSSEHDKPEATRCDAAIVRRFLTIVSEHATQACAGIEGYLQVSRVHPADDKLTIAGRFKPGDIDAMVEVATADAEAGFNSYIEARLLKGATAGRGKASHTVGVFALVIDSDADTGKASTVTLPPSLKIETSPPGNHHAWYFLQRAITAKAATELGAAMRHHGGGDQDSGVVTQPYRVAGTPNYPNRSKQGRGRIVVHPTRILEHTGKIYTAAELRAALPQPKKAERKNKDTAEDNIDWRFAEENLPGDLGYLIQHGVEIGQRSEQFHHVVGWLKHLGWNADNICSLLSSHPAGIASKFKDRLAAEIQRSFDKCDGPPPQKKQGKDKEGDDEKDLAAMNAVYAITKVGGKTRVFELEEGPTYPGCRVPVFSTIPDFVAFHAKRKKKLPTSDGKSKEVGLGKWWIDHPQRRQYDGIVYAPHGAENGRLNLWTGYGCEQRAGNCSLYLAHLRDNVCSGNEEHSAYLLNWMADAVQHPERAGEVAVVLRGAEGVGKGVLAKQFGRLFGAHFRHVTQAKHLTGHFNAHLQQCSVLFADEAFFAGDRAHEGILKALISEETLLIEPKGVDTFAVRNSLHIVLSSNNEWVIPAGADARRFFVLDVASTHMRDYPYFGAIAAEMDNGGREGLLDLLMRRDLSKFNIRAVPLTSALANQKAYSRRGIDRLIEILAHDGILPCADASGPSITITSGEDKSEGFYPAARKLAPDLKHVSSQIIAVSLQKDWGCSRWKSGYQRGIQFPPLADLRDRFDKRHGKQEWPVEPGPTVEWGG